MSSWQVYVIRNKTNRKGYVGITTKPLSDRLNERLSDAFPGRWGKSGRLLPLHTAIQKYGEDSFLTETVEFGLIFFDYAAGEVITPKF